ncbi:MAG: hypothetical protein AVDCRST_MAG49-2830 [uncultured Thermomicrobiales bacterium]|uniref:Uncharacterized protein n=1 Tax=uncultured Thermomicrobiales bacterium TaxID=1645740 RepID=A0A6J4V129_9BACT|nr:MAG: hypothetical protein AVDCRST_MAG49-2830 [uncultured Thermomicrobiales bacterium]
MGTGRLGETGRRVRVGREASHAGSKARISRTCQGRPPARSPAGRPPLVPSFGPAAVRPDVVDSP